MSLKSAVDNPRTPLRLFLDRELSAGPKPLRESYRAQHRANHVLAPLPGVGTEAGTVGTAIDTRLRLAFTAAAPVDLPTRIGIEMVATDFQRIGLRMRAVGNELASRLTRTVTELDLANRATAVERTHDEEENLARLLIAAAWFQVAARTSIGFEHTPLFLAASADPDSFTLEHLLQLPHRDLVADVVAQLYRAAEGPLAALRARTRPENCAPGPTFPHARIAADADLVADGLLLDFKSARKPHDLPKNTAWQLLGYLLLDTTDQYRIDTVGLYMTRSGILATWPVDEFLALLGTCRRELPALRAVLAEFLTGCDADREPVTEKDRTRIRKLFERLAPAIGPNCCPVCAQPVPTARRTYCTQWCFQRSTVLRPKGMLPGGRLKFPERRQHLGLPDNVQIVNATTRLRQDEP
ncbi:hypothetical protein AMK09_37565 [Streptomyces sp. CB02488]|uniref:hypothetical protein n=1 Tax=Streptomyces sp. CB02488 TaxID=1703920 RepID=UPI00093D4FF9|nr:hypothetical protein [Streptomyces sp. CB02488]OKK05268.1 hypothetical protein AMK09_37565 [Streptomyces sp. CB02488]